MDEHGEVQGKKMRTRRQAGRRAGRSRGHRYPFEIRRNAGQFCLEEGFPVEQVALLG